MLEEQGSVNNTKFYIWAGFSDLRHIAKHKNLWICHRLAQTLSLQRLLTWPSFPSCTTSFNFKNVNLSVQRAFDMNDTVQRNISVRWIYNKLNFHLGIYCNQFCSENIPKQTKYLIKFCSLAMLSYTECMLHQKNIFTFISHPCFTFHVIIFNFSKNINKVFTFALNTIKDYHTTPLNSIRNMLNITTQTFHINTICGRCCSRRFVATISS